MNSKPLLLLLIVSGLALSAIAARNGELLVLTVPFLAYMMVGLIQFPHNTRLAASRTTDTSSAAAGEPVQVTLHLANSGDAIAHLRVDDTLPARAELPDAPPQQVFPLPAHGSAEMSYRFVGGRGLWAWHTLDVYPADPLGLFETRIRLPAPGEIIIRPLAADLRGQWFKPRRTLRTPGPVPVPLPGSGTDFLGVREYRMGDALRQINWRLTARHPGKLFTNDHERHEVGDYGLILDTRQADSEVFERAVGGAASLAQSLLLEGNRISLLVFGKSLSATYPGYGKRQLSLVLRSLAAAAQSPFVPLEYLEYFPTRLFPNRAVLVVVSSCYPSDQLTYARLRAAGFEIVLVSPDPIDFGARAEKGDPPSQFAIRAARIERRAGLLALSKLGVKIIDWNLDQPIHAALHGLARHAANSRNLAA